MTEDQTLFYKKALKASEKLMDLLKDDDVVNSILELTDRSRKRRRSEVSLLKEEPNEQSNTNS